MSIAEKPCFGFDKRGLVVRFAQANAESDL